MTDYTGRKLVQTLLLGLKMWLYIGGFGKWGEARFKPELEQLAKDVS